MTLHGHIRSLTSPDHTLLAYRAVATRESAQADTSWVLIDDDLTLVSDDLVLLEHLRAHIIEEPADVVEIDRDEVTDIHNARSGQPRARTHRERASLRPYSPPTPKSREDLVERINLARMLRASDIPSDVNPGRAQELTVNNT